jgi:hypothetical protein
MPLRRPSVVPRRRTGGSAWRGVGRLARFRIVRLVRGGRPCRRGERSCHPPPRGVARSAHSTCQISQLAGGKRSARLTDDAACVWQFVAVHLTWGNRTYCTKQQIECEGQAPVAATVSASVYLQSSIPSRARRSHTQQLVGA